MSVLALIADAFRLWAYDDKYYDTESQMSISRLYAIQWEFYEYLFQTLTSHFIYFVILFCFINFSNVDFKAFVRSFLLAVSTKIVFLPLLVWTELDQFFWSFIFIKLISISFFAIQMALNSK